MKKYENDIWDIAIFGSFVKEKDNPNDIDVAVVFKRHGLKLAETISDDIEKISNKIHYNWIFLEELEKNSLWMTITTEGFSVKNNKMFSDVFGYKTGVLFYYNLSNLSNKSKFSHALYGRGENDGKINEVKGEVIGRGVIFVSMEKSDSFRDFLNYWKVDYKMHKIIIV